jgi:hypothetical protein
MLPGTWAWRAPWLCRTRIPSPDRRAAAWRVLRSLRIVRVRRERRVFDHDERTLKRWPCDLQLPDVPLIRDGCVYPNRASMC